VGVGVPGWSPELERSFKEILYRFLEEVQSTKAAFYLLAPDGSYVLMAQYGFGRRDLLAAELHARDPLVLRARDLRSRPHAINHPDEIPDLAQYLEGAGTARLLLVPLWGGSRLLGFVDARDKGRRRTFEPTDVQRAAGIAVSFLDLIRQAGLYPDLDPPVMPEVVTTGDRLMPSASAPVLKAELDQRGLADLLAVAESSVQRPGIVAVAVSVVEEESAGSVVLSLGGGGVIDVDAMIGHQRETVRQERRDLRAPDAWRVEQVALPGLARPAATRLIASGLLLGSSGWALVGSAVGSVGSTVAQEVVEGLHAAAAAAREGARLRFARRRLARRVLQPRPEEYVELATHSLAVSRLAVRLAQELGMDEPQVEDVALVGLLHDVGLRDLEYGRIYRHPAPGADERRLFQQHSVVGEHLLQDCGLDDLARAVRHHHERWDGRGYPDHLGGDQIPLLARLVHVAEVWDVLTAATSYRRPVGGKRALEIMRTAGGEQFDPELVECLARVV
jgi:putative nucleotidyltransferase with HDIG domain